MNNLRVLGNQFRYKRKAKFLDMPHPYITKKMLFSFEKRKEKN